MTDVARTDGPEISIITPCYNAARYLRDAIESVRRQHGVRVEHLVIDAGSKDDTCEILRQYPHVRWISETDQGQSDAFNKGLALARAPLIGWLNADDVYERGAVAKVVQFFRDHPSASIVNGHLALVDPDGKQVRFAPARSSAFWLRHFWFRWYGLNHPSTFYRKAVFDEVGPVDVALHYAMDYDFYLRASLRYEFHDIDVLTTRMRVHPESKTSQGRDKFASDIRMTFKKLWKRQHPWFYRYELLGLRMHAARTRLLESLNAIRERRNRKALRDTRLDAVRARVLSFFAGFRSAAESWRGNSGQKSWHTPPSPAADSATSFPVIPIR
jgi:glycosyltransferase involved in cell wall biosynthesis